MKSRIKDIITVFIIQLVLTIPFYTSSVYATINDLSVKGGDGVEGYAKQNDFLNFDVKVSIKNNTIKKDQVVLGSDPGIKFDKCTSSVNNGSECTLRIPSNGTESFESKPISFTVNLFKDDNTLDDSKSGAVTIDNKAPEVTLSTAQSKFTSQQDVVIDYEINDFACDDPSCEGKCAGIKNIEFFTLNGTFKQTVELETSECSIQSSITIDSKKFTDGANSVFAKATDKFNKASQEKSVTFTVDANPPEILSNSLDIRRKDVSISAFSKNKVQVDILVNISANDLKLNSVTANLSELNPSLNLKNSKASCVSGEDSINTCKWSIELNPKTAGSKTIVINAPDTSGNSINATISKQLSLDDKGPVIQSLSTTKTANGKIFAKKTDNKVTAAFEESTGLSADEVFLNIVGTKLAASECSKESNWICSWENVNFDSSAKMSIGLDTKDILGNPVTSDFNVDVIVDKEPPLLKSININPVGGTTPAFLEFFKIGDKISVVANLTDDNDITAVADFSKFIGGQDKTAASCQRIQADEQICTWNTDGINLQTSGDIVFNFSDSAGNELIVTKSLKTFGLENTASPDFWTSSADCSPKTLDRQLGPLINERVFCEVTLTQKSTTKSVSTVFIGPATCTGDVSIVDSVDTFNTEAASRSPFIKITLKKDEFKINDASLSCSFNIFSKVGIASDITKNPEIESVKIKLAFFNLPLGELDEEIQRKIKDAKDDADGIFKLISALNKIVFYAKKICGLINTLYNVVALLYSVAIILGVLDAIGEKTIWGFTIKPAAIAGCTTASTTRVTVGAAYENIVNKFCSYVNCKQSILWGDSVKKYIDSMPGSKYVPGGLSSYMDPQHSIIVAALFACLPGIIYGLDKYRQIKCLYADCLENSVGKEGLPITSCEDEKAYATCKYVTGEIFAVIPYTALFDHFMGIIKNALSNPFIILGAGISIACGYVCPNPQAETRTAAYTACETFRLFSQLGSVASDFKNIIDEGFKIREDYCDRLKNNENNSTAAAPTTTTSSSTAR